MADRRKLIESVVVLGAGLGAAYVASRPAGKPRAAGSKFVDWQRVEETALRVVRNAPSTPVVDRVGLNARYREMVARSADLIGGYSQTPLRQQIGPVYVFDRDDWIRANLEGFERLFGRIEEIQAHIRPPDTLAAVLLGEANRRLLSTQLGVLIGYLARRVLGQYDLSLLGKEAITSGSLYFVEPNIDRLERELGVAGDELRMWIALHETTHAYEFEGNPWLREYFNSLLEEYFQGLNRQLRGARAARLLGRVVEEWRRGGQREGWMELVMTPEQRSLFRKLQGTMSLLEGYSNHIMNTIGADVLSHFEEIRLRIEQRQARNRLADRLFARLTGLNVKMEQYRLGEAFVDDVVRQRGIQFMNRVWSGPEALPTMEEIRAPSTWVCRIDRMEAHPI